MHVTTRRRHPGGHPPSFMQPPAAHAAAPDRVHMGDKPRYVQAASGRNTCRGARKEALGRLPMRNGSRPGTAQPCESANSCIYNIRHTAPGDERPLFPATFCGILYHANCISLYVLHIKHAPPLLCFLQRPPCCLWYDGDAQASSNRASGKKETGWTLSRWW